MRYFLRMSQVNRSWMVLSGPVTDQIVKFELKNILVSSQLSLVRHPSIEIRPEIKPVIASKSDGEFDPFKKRVNINDEVRLSPSRWPSHRFPAFSLFKSSQAANHVDIIFRELFG